MKFEQCFPKFVGISDTIKTQVDGFDIEARIVHDDMANIDDDDCHKVTPGDSKEVRDSILSARAKWFADEWFYCGVVLSVSRLRGRIR